MEPLNPHRAYYPALDGLRGLAILLVVVFHNFGFIRYFFFGWLGVDLFFVLSGFLITGILVETQGTSNYLRNFYARRILRIFPLYYLTLVILLLLIPRIIQLPTDLTYYKDNQWWLWTYLENWLYIFKPSSNSQILHHFWSLAVEEQFYLVWPLVILIIRKPQRLILLLALVLLSAIALRFIVWIYQIDNLAYFNLYTFSRIDGICIGSMLFLVQKTNSDFLPKYTSVIVFGLATFNFIFYFFNQYYNFSFPYLAIAGYTTFALLFALLVYEGTEGKNRVVNFLFNNAFMKFFGRISYGLYIFHWPVYLLFKDPVAKWITQNFSSLPPQLSASLITTSAAILLSITSYHYFESYFIRQKKRYAQTNTAQ